MSTKMLAKAREVLGGAGRSIKSTSNTKKKRMQKS